MHKRCYAMLLLATVGHICCWISIAFAEDAECVRVEPKESDEILANPGMGWETFHRTANDDKNLPAWIPSTVHYARWGWGTLEPEKGKIDYDFLDGILKETHEAGQKLAFRAMCCSSYPRRPYRPDWLRDVGGKVVTTRYGDGPELEVPVLDDPAVLAAHIDFIKRLGARYDGHADIDHVDLGSVGWWGEWHMSQSTNAPMPTPETQKKIVDAYFAAFQKTPLVMLIGGGEMLQYAVDNGGGWRADCLGDMGGFSKTWCHMRMAYPQQLPKAGATDAWKTAPVAWETCWDMRKWMDEGWSLRFIFNYALALHGSVINNKSAPLPEGKNIRPEVERFLRRLGYRLVLKELEHPKQAKAGEAIKVSMKWQNTGSAPCYQPYRLAYRMTDGEGRHRILVGKVTVEKWLPGEIELFTEEFFKQPADLPPGPINEVVETIRLPDDLKPGDYKLSIGVVGKEGVEPLVQLGIKGRSEDGWYSLSKINVTPPTNNAIEAGDHSRSIKVDGRKRSYLVHVPDAYDSRTPTPVILVLHGAGTNARIMVPFCGMNKKSDEGGFITVYPNGTGAAGILLTWNSGGLQGKMGEGKPDDVEFIGKLLDDLATVVNLDPRKIYATGMSNGGMMCYRLAAELSDRIAAIAPVAGTMAIAEAKPNRPVPVMHFHGTADRIVPFAGPGPGTPKFLSFKSVEETVQTWAKLNKCVEEPVVEKLEDKAEDGTNVIKRTYAPKAGGSEVVLIEIEGGGHTWPGIEPPVQFIGQSTQDISANDTIWGFFQRFSLPTAACASE